jgi:hypothetical protein
MRRDPRVSSSAVGAGYHRERDAGPAGAGLPSDDRVVRQCETMSAFAGNPRLRIKARAFVEKWATSEVKVVASKARKAMKALGEEGEKPRVSKAKR